MALRALVFACVFALPVAARAQMCSGMMTGTIGLAEPQPDGSFLTIPSSQVSAGVFGRAECDCASAAGNPDLNLEIKLTTPFPASTSSAVLCAGPDAACVSFPMNSGPSTPCSRR